MKVLAAAVFTASIVAMPAFADTIKEKHVIQQDSMSPMPSTGVVIEQRAAADPFPEQGSDNPSGVLGQGDLRDESKGPETRMGVSERTLENSAGQLDPQEAARDRAVVIQESPGVVTAPPAVTATPAPGAIILEDQTASDPFPEQGSDNPSGNLSEGDLRDESKSPETRMGVSPGTLENTPGQLDPREAR